MRDFARAILDRYQMQGIFWITSNFYGESFEKRLRGRIGKESDLSGAIFEEGVSQEATVLFKDLPDEAVKKRSENG